MTEKKKTHNKLNRIRSCKVSTSLVNYDTLIQQYIIKSVQEITTFFFIFFFPVTGAKKFLPGDKIILVNSRKKVIRVGVYMWPSYASLLFRHRGKRADVVFFVNNIRLCPPRTYYKSPTKRVNKKSGDFYFFSLIFSAQNLSVRGFRSCNVRVI